jgi:hypothetical protein
MADAASQLTPEQQLLRKMAINAKIIRQTSYGLQDGNGTDVTLVDHALVNLSPEQRLRRGDAALSNVRSVQCHVRPIAK